MMCYDVPTFVISICLAIRKLHNSLNNLLFHDVFNDIRLQIIIIKNTIYSNTNCTQIGNMKCNIQILYLPHT